LRQVPCTVEPGSLGFLWNGSYTGKCPRGNDLSRTVGFSVFLGRSIGGVKTIQGSYRASAARYGQLAQRAIGMVFIVSALLLDQICSLRLKAGRRCSD
jgi:hypothetical protein